jgi:5-formyltetrahydrofolate cyclo-ligase
MRARIAALTSDQRAAESNRVVAAISQSEFWRRARTVMLFIPLADEINVLPLVDEALDHHKVVLLPRFDSAKESYQPAQVINLSVDLVRGPFGVTEPGPDCPAHPLKPLDVTVVPGLAFDRVGRRLGRGKGHYDRLLADAGGQFWGVGFESQLLAELPVESHDVVLNCIVTPAHWVEVGAGRR